MYVFRIEDKNGYGVQNFGGNQGHTCLYTSIYNIIKLHSWELGYMRPRPEDDGIDAELINEYHLFAFENIDQLNKWFTVEERFAGAFIGANICVYNVQPDRVIKGKSQLIFDSRNAILIAKLPMNVFDDTADHSIDQYLDDDWADWT